MKQKILAVCDLEEMYALRLTEYIVEKGTIPYILHLFTKPEELERFLARQEVTVLLIGENALQELSSEVPVPNVFVLAEDGRTNKPEYYYINKYQSPEKILGEMLTYIAEKGEEFLITPEQEEKMKVVGIYSPIKRCLQTSFALTMGQIIAGKHRVLYINFEMFSGLEQMLNREFRMDLMDLVYYFKCAREKLILKLPSIVQTINGLDFIPPGQTGPDLQQISGENWLELLQILGQAGQYEYLILDLTDAMVGLFELLSYCDKIYTITRDDGFAMAKIDQYERVLQRNEMDDVVHKTVKCRFPFFKKLPTDLNLLTHGELAGYVREIVRTDLYEQ